MAHSGDDDGVVKAALGNQIVLRKIFSFLESSDLRKCRLVNKFWEFEVSSYIREFRRCNVSISDYDPCSSLNHLNQGVTNRRNARNGATASWCNGATAS